jgi:hypothetical protein
VQEAVQELGALCPPNFQYKKQSCWFSKFLHADYECYEKCWLKYNNKVTSRSQKLQCDCWNWFCSWNEHPASATPTLTAETGLLDMLFHPKSNLLKLNFQSHLDQHHHANTAVVLHLSTKCHCSIRKKAERRCRLSTSVTAGLLTGNQVFAHMFQHSRKLEIINHLCLIFQCLLCSLPDAKQIKRSLVPQPYLYILKKFATFLG